MRRASAALAASLRRSGADVRITVDADAHHAFDSVRQGGPIRLPNLRREMEELLRAF